MQNYSSVNHGRAGRIDVIKFKIDYLKKVKDLFNHKTTESFIEVIKGMPQFIRRRP